jgi:hypothetical protein
MNNLTQSAMDAVRKGDRKEALELIQRALSANPNDIDALLALASFVDEPTRKRQVLNRILSVESTHKAAREMLLDMDRAEMSAYRPQPISAPVSTPQSKQQTTPPSPKPINTAMEKPLVFRSSTTWLVVVYLFTTIFCCAGFLIASQDLGKSFPSFMLALLFGLTALSASSKVEVKETGLRASGLFGGSEIKWNEIAKVQANPMKRKLELISNTGKSVKVSTQVKGYPVIVELLRQKRPDLFGGAASSPTQGNISAGGPSEQPALQRAENPGSVLTFTETKTFTKGFFRQYALCLVMVPVALLMVWLGLADPELKTASFISAAFCVIVMIVPFFQVSAIKVEPNKLTLETFFEEKELSAHQIKEIKMQSVRGRYGRVTNFVNIIPLEGKKYPLGGFSDGEEILYGFLTNWWNKYQSGE